MNIDPDAQLPMALAALGFYLFVTVWAGIFIWSRTKERLAIQETLQKLIQAGVQPSPEVIDSLRQPKPRRTIAEILARARTFRYWGIFLAGLGAGIALWALRYADSSIPDLREITQSAIMLFIIPGLFCLAHSIITHLVHKSSKD